MDILFGCFFVVFSSFQDFFQYATATVAGDVCPDAKHLSEELPTTFKNDLILSMCELCFQHLTVSMRGEHFNQLRPHLALNRHKRRAKFCVILPLIVPSLCE